MSSSDLGPDTAASRLIRQLLISLMAKSRFAAVASLSILDIDQSQAYVVRPYCRITSSGRLNTLSRDMPSMPDWRVLLPLLRAGECPVLRVADLQIKPPPRHLTPWGDASTLVCPAADPMGELVGAVFLTFDEHDDPPLGAELLDMKVAGMRAGGHIAAILRLGTLDTTRTPAATAA